MGDPKGRPSTRVETLLRLAGQAINRSRDDLEDWRIWGAMVGPMQLLHFCGGISIVLPTAPLALDDEEDHRVDAEAGPG